MYFIILCSGVIQRHTLACSWNRTCNGATLANTMVFAKVAPLHVLFHSYDNNMERD